MPTIETMMEALRKCPNCVLDLSEATEREIQSEYSMLKDELFSMLDKDKAEEQILEKSKKIEYYITEYSVGFLVQKMQEGEYYVPTGKNAWILSATSSSALEITSVLHKIWDNNNFFAKNRLPTPLELENTSNTQENPIISRKNLTNRLYHYILNP